MSQHTGSPERFGKWLDLTCQNRGIRNRDLARKLHVSDSAVSSWRSGRKVPGMDTTMRLAKILDTDPIRLAVTAGIMDGELVGIKVLPLPEPTVQRETVKATLKKIKGITMDEIQRMLDAYDATRATSEENGE